METIVQAESIEEARFRLQMMRINRNVGYTNLKLSRNECRQPGVEGGFGTEPFRASCVARWSGAVSEALQTREKFLR